MSFLFYINLFSLFVSSFAVWTVPTNPIADFFNSTIDFEDLSFSVNFEFVRELLFSMN